jgi:hypothetical protein
LEPADLAPFVARKKLLRFRAGKEQEQTEPVNEIQNVALVLALSGF